ncbi:hypothetical protein CEE35_07730 [Candidatus Aerophobetes bacterium Ae_b3b]|nr:MAG: hypothetical protein CEE35_07730 [Candidatus Aerophobetes bacterium Ae_b3b]
MYYPGIDHRKIFKGENRASPIPSECPPQRPDRQSRLSLRSGHERACSPLFSVAHLVAIQRNF